MQETNEYQNSEAKSLRLTPSGDSASVCVMAPGEYHIDPTTADQMRIVTGEMLVKFDGKPDFKRFAPGEKFTIPKNKKFYIKVPVETAYICLHQ